MINQICEMLVFMSVLICYATIFKMYKYMKAIDREVSKCISGLHERIDVLSKSHFDSMIDKNIVDKK